jgi:hypothetical protein
MSVAIAACGQGEVSIEPADGEALIQNAEKLGAALAPVADATVRSGTFAERSYGTETVLWADADYQGSERRAFMTFEVPPLPSWVRRIYLAVYVVDGGNSGELWLSKKDVKEGSTDWNDRPAGVQRIEASRKVEKDRWAFFDVTSVIWLDGKYTFGLAHPPKVNRDGAAYASRETSRPPRLLFLD